MNHEVFSPAWHIDEHLTAFFGQIAQGKIDIYNEFSLQHELGYYLRSTMTNDVLIQFERPASFFGIKTKLIKKEIDIALFNPKQECKVAIELKYPRNGQHPEQMFKACQDIAFLEELCADGFDRGFLVMVVDDPLFYAGGGTEGIYKHFRAGMPVCGYIQKPTGQKNDAVTIIGNHLVEWKNIIGHRKYMVVEVQQISSVSL